MENNKKRLLLIEDDSVDQLVFKRLVKEEKLPYEYTIADSVKTATEVLSSTKFDVIILDYALGDGTAFDLMELIDDTPLIFTTGAGDEETAVRAMKSGVFDYLIKDLDRNYVKLLPLVIDKAMKTKRDKEYYKMLSQAVESIIDCVYITDNDYKIQFINNSFTNIYGYSESNILDKHCSMLWKDYCDFDNALNVFNCSDSGEFYHMKKDGSIFPISISRSIVKDTKGNSIAFINIVRDITEKKRIETKILEERDRAQSYLDIAGVIMLILDNHGNVSLINKKGCDILGYNKESIIGKNWFDNFIPMNIREEEESTFLKQVSGYPNFVDYRESYICSKNGNEKIIAWHYTPLRDSQGNIVAILSSGEDITLRMEVDKVKTEFVNTVSHEIRTPLTVILAISQLLLSQPNLDQEKMKKYFNTIYVESKRLSDLVNDFLDIQRMETGNQAFTKETISLISVIDEVIELYEIDCTHDIILDMDKSSYPLIYADYAKIKQLVTNLISNAIKYSPDSKEEIIKVRQNEDSLQVSIVDKGLGIPENSIPMLFKKFYRVDNSDHRKVGGTGLGLVICKEIVVAHGGTIGVTSKLGEGSEFVFTIPISS